jgi:signal transduction histidine kinase
MRRWLRGTPGGLAAFVLIVVLVAGGLGWVTAAALRLEREQFRARAEAELAGRVRLALWQLDGRLSPLLAREDSRPYNHYIALYRPPQVLVSRKSRLVVDDAVRELSPLLTADLPDWMVLHFQADADSGWGSPQVPFPGLIEHLKKGKVPATFRNVTPERARLLEQLSRRLSPATLLAAVEQKGPPPTVPDRTVMLYPSNTAQVLTQSPPQQAMDRASFNRFDQQQKVQNEFANPNFRDQRDNILRNFRSQGQSWLAESGQTSAAGVEMGVSLSPMVPVWLTVAGGREYLLLVRQVRIDDIACRACQGIVLDADRLRTLLAHEIHDLLPEASFTPVREAVAPDPERTMAMLPFRLDPGEVLVPADPAWTPLRIGLVLAWVAAGVALLAVGLGGWFLLDLSERRFRFVSAVTHELRTPLTTLRLYLDMLTGGMVREEERKSEYIQTLHGEAERLSRLVANVLDFSRLEKQRPRLVRSQVAIDGLLGNVRQTWQGRCRDAGKELVVESDLPAGAVLETDADLLQQVLANLIDNACKYSRDALDPHIWLRATAAGGRVCFEVEDCGPGVPPRERRTIFRPFRRGRGADATGGGVGLGLALARRWARLLGGRLTLRGGGRGACFRLELAPAITPSAS